MQYIFVASCNVISSMSPAAPRARSATLALALFSGITRVRVVYWRYDSRGDAGPTKGRSHAGIDDPSDDEECQEGEWGGY